MSSFEWTEQFENRKRDHIRIALDPRTQAEGHSGLNRIELIHDALPEMNFNDISIGCEMWGRPLQSPLFISSMTAGHGDGRKLNLILARAAAKRGWAMGVGSQRRELHDPEANSEWRDIRAQVPDVVLMGNIGLAELIQTASAKIQTLVERLGAVAMIVHANALQECLQPEGNPHFRGGVEALTRLAQDLPVPVILKETGCGFSASTLARLLDSGVSAVDVGGLGGTHWGRVEGQRSQPGSVLANVAETFADWGISTVQSVLSAIELKPKFEIWASGGVRSGLDAAKLLALGARKVGVAKPMMAAALAGEDAVVRLMEQMDLELRVALFCTGSGNLHEIEGRSKWRFK